MNYCFYILTVLSLLIVQTSLVTFFDIFKNFYNLQAIFVVYLSLFRSWREGIVGAFFAGVLTDSLSGGPWGLYMTSCLWLFAGIKWIVGYLHVENIMLIPFIITGGILFENIILVGALVILKRGLYFPGEVFHSIFVQVIWSLFTGPFILFGFKAVQKKWELWVAKFVSEKNG